MIGGLLVCKKNEPYEIFDWFNKHKVKINLSENQHTQIDFLFNEIKSLGQNLENL